MGLIVSPGESCTYPGTSTEFSVDSSGTGKVLFITAGTGIDARNTTIDGVTYNFKASKQDDGNWIIEVKVGRWLPFLYLCNSRRLEVGGHEKVCVYKQNCTTYII